MSILRLIVTIPAYNEAATIAEVISNIPRTIKDVDEVKVLVIDDGSSDDTATLARNAGADAVITHSTNMGLGRAFLTGINYAIAMKADLVVNIDADGQFNPQEIPNLIEPIIKGEADVVIGSRFLSIHSKRSIPFVKRSGNKIFSKIISWLSGQSFTDTQCGFRAYSREALLRLTIFDRYTYTQESLLNLASKGLRIKEVPISVKYYTQRKSRLIKHNLTYGFKALLIVLRTFRDFAPLRFFGGIGIITMSAGLAMGLLIFIRWLLTGRASPYTSLISVGGALVILGFLILLLALIADMFARQRQLQEEVLYHLRKKVYSEIDA